METYSFHLFWLLLRVANKREIHLFHVSVGRFCFPWSYFLISFLDFAGLWCFLALTVGTFLVSFQMTLSVLPVVLLSLHVVRVDSVAMTFESRDPITGSPVSCDRCPPGTYLRSQCSSERKSDCANCPHGSFTEVWNHIGRCLRCGVCSHNQVVKTPCTADSDCQCQCKPGYYYKTQYDMCLPHSACPPGQGVRAKGRVRRAAAWAQSFSS